MANEIIVEFVPDLTRLQSGIDTLVSSGQLSQGLRDELKAAQKPVDQLSKSVVTASGKMVHSFEEIETRVQSMVQEFIDGFMEGINETLKESGVTFDEFVGKLKNGEKQHKSLKGELRAMNEELARLALAGEQGSQQYIELSQKAAQYRDALGDVNEEVNKMASDTANIDTAVEAIGALAAAGQIAAGAYGLFNAESKVTQEVLTRINAAMAIANGVQQISNMLQNRSNLIRAISNTQQKLAIAQTAIETGLQSKNVIVKGAATAAQWALNTAMAANPAGLLVAAIVALVGALVWFASAAGDSEKKLAALNWEMEQLKRNSESAIENLEFAGDVAVARLEAAGAAGSKITKQTLANMRAVNDEIENQLAGIPAMYDAITAATKAGSDERKTRMEDLANFEKGLQAKQAQNTRNLILGGVKLQKELTDESKKAAEQRAADAEKARQRQREIDLARLNDQKAAIERQLLNVEQGSQQEMELRQKLIGANANIELFNEKLTANQRLLIQEQALKERAKLETDYHKNRQSIAIANQISEINAELKQITLGAAERENLSVMLLNKQRESELAEVKNNAAKVAEINANYDRQIAETRLQIRRDQLEHDLELVQLNNAASTRSLERTISNENATLQARTAAIDTLAQRELEAITRRRNALEGDREYQLISEQQYQIELARLKDQEKQVFETSEQAKTEMVKSENAKRLAAFQSLVDSIAGYMNQAMGAVSAIFDAISANEVAKIEQREQQLEQAREAGAISEKTYIERQRKLENERKLQQREQARREKAMNIFSALVNGAAAIVKAAPNPFLIAFTSALVAAQVAAIIATPLPRFGKGTKKAPRGFAEVGETGTELIQTDRGYYLAEHPQIVWMKGGERVYNPHETKQMMKTPVADRKLVNNDFDRRARAQSNNPGVMAKMIGDEIAKHPRLVVSMDAKGFTTNVVSQLARQTYLNTRYNYNG